MPDTPPGSSLPFNVDEVFADLRAEIGLHVGQIAVMRSQLRAAEARIAELTAQAPEPAPSA